MRVIEHMSRCQRNRLTAFKDRFDNVGGEECQRENPAHFAIVYPCAGSDLRCRLRGSGRKLFKPSVGLGDRLNEGLVEECWTNLLVGEDELCLGRRYGISRASARSMKKSPPAGSSL